MLKIDRATVDAKIQNGYSFDFGKYISDGFEIFKKEWLLFSLYGLISIFMLMLSVLSIVGIFMFIIPTVLGYSVAAEKVERGESLEFNDFFGAFKNFGDYAVLTLVTIGVSFLVLLPFGGFFILIKLSEESQAAGTILAIFFVFYYILAYIFFFLLQAGVIFAPYLIHYGNYSGYDAFVASIKLFRKQLWWIVLFLIVVSFISSVGYLACGIGIFCSIAVGYLVQYAMVKDILSSPEHNEIDQIGEQAYH